MLFCEKESGFVDTHSDAAARMLDKAAHGDGLPHHLIGHERRRCNYGHLLSVLFDGQIRAAVFVVPADGQHMQFVQLGACVLRQIRMSIGSFLTISSVSRVCDINWASVVSV